MSTVMYACGCYFTHSMYGDRQLLDFGLCSGHIAYPRVLEAPAKDLQKIILELIDEELRESETLGVTVIKGVLGA